MCFKHNQALVNGWRGWGTPQKQYIWHSFQISLNYACKDFQFGTLLENRLQRVSIFLLAGNPEISSTTLKTFCCQSIRCYSQSQQQLPIECFSLSRNLPMQKQVRVCALDVIIFQPTAQPSIKVSWESWQNAEAKWKLCLWDTTRTTIENLIKTYNG